MTQQQDARQAAWEKYCQTHELNAKSGRYRGHWNAGYDARCASLLSALEQAREDFQAIANSVDREYRTELARKGHVVAREAIRVAKEGTDD